VSRQISYLYSTSVHTLLSKSLGTSSSTNAASLIKHFTPRVYRQHYWRFPSKHHTKSHFLSNRTPRLVKPQEEYSFLNLKRHFNNSEFSASGGKIWELNWAELWTLPCNLFKCVNFHFCTFQFVSSVFQ
jgi:hypothetical protein